jgi:hypothetical protein
LVVAASALAPFVFASATRAADTSTSNDISLGVSNAIYQYIISPIIGLLSRVALILVDFLIKVVSYTGYATSPAVTMGWVVVRDIANMFFVAMFLVIAIGTIVNPTRFQGIKAITRLLLYAIFVNFSKTIVLLCVDASNIVMMTFVNGFKAAAGGNFVDALGMQGLVTMNPASQEFSLPGLIGTQFLAVIMMVLIIVIIGILVVAMTMRMVTLWFLIVLSPLAFAMGGTEMTKPRYAEWWKRLSAQLTTGPLVAFFLWLTLATVQQSPVDYKNPDKAADIAGTGAGSISAAQTAGVGAGNSLTCGSGNFCQEGIIMRFVIASLMLLGGLMFAKEFEGVGGELAGAAWNKGKGYANAVGKTALKIGAAGVGIAAAPVLGGAIAGGYMMSRTEAGKGMLGRAGKGFGTGISNLQGRKGVIGAIARYAPGLSMAGRAATRAGEGQLAAADKTARESMANLSQAQVEEIAQSRLSNYPQRRAAALRIAKDKDYRKAEAGTAKFKMLQQSMAVLEPIKNDKDVSDAITEVKDARPDAMEMAEQKKGKKVDYGAVARGFNPRTDASKLKLDKMSKDDANAFLAGLSDENLERLEERSSGDVSNVIERFRMDHQSTGKELTDRLAQGDEEFVKNAPAERYVPGTTGDNRPKEVNTELAQRVIETGNAKQIRAFIDRKDIKAFADGMRDTLRDRVNLTDPNHAGFTPQNDRMSDENMRLAEGAVIAGADMGDVYHMRQDGKFTDTRMLASFDNTQANMTPEKKAEFMFNIPKDAISTTSSAGHPVSELTASMVDKLGRNDLVALTKQAKTDDQKKQLERILQAVNAVYNDATQSHATRQRADILRQQVANNPETARFMKP